MGTYRINNISIIRDSAMEWNPETKLFTFVDLNGKRSIIGADELSFMEQSDEGTYQIRFGPSFKDGMIASYSGDLWRNGAISFEKEDSILKIGSHPVWLFDPRLKYIRGI